MPILHGSNGRFVSNGLTKAGGSRLTGSSFIKGSAKRGEFAAQLKGARRAGTAKGSLGSIQQANRYLLNRTRIAQRIRTDRAAYRAKGFKVVGGTASKKAPGGHTVRYDVG